MNVQELLFAPYQGYSTLQITLEITAALFGLLSVYFSMKKSIWVYPTGILSTTIYVYILFVFGLLGDMLINVYYTIMSIYGWVLWSRSADTNFKVQVEYTTPRQWITAGVLFTASLLLVLLIYYYKPAIDNGFSTASVSLGFAHLDWANYLDILTTSIFLVGMWLMAKRKIENWIFWIVGDIICVPMFLYKGLAITSLQYLLFTVLAYLGYRAWIRSAQDTLELGKS